MREIALIIILTTCVAGCGGDKKMTRADWDCVPRAVYRTETLHGSSGDLITLSRGSMGLNPGDHYCN